jgi:predicted transcriptional regulator
MVQKSKVLPILSGLMLFGVSTWLGFLGRPTEMGLAVAAGALGFLFSNMDRIVKIRVPGFAAEMCERKAAESVVAEQTDNAQHLKALAFQIDPSRQKIMSALIHTDYNSRYAAGITVETGLTSEVVSRELDWLLNNGLVTRRAGKNGYLWNLTEKGMALLPIVIFGKAAA